MRDSGFEWIGKIPIDWEVSKLKTLGNTKSGLANKKPEDFGHGYPFISYKNVYTNIILDEKYPDLVESTEIDRTNYNILKGDAFFTGSSETIEELGFASMCLKDIPNATYNGFCIRFRPNSFEKYNPHFMKYSFRSEVARGYLTQNDNSITRANLSQKVLKIMPVVIPSLQEQQKIVDYLDEKVSEIDNIITQTNLSIKEYKKYKYALITKCVTNGLDANISMQKTNIDWIDEIPKSWNFKKLKYIFSIKKEIAGREGYDILSVTQSGLKIKDISTNEGQIAFNYSKYQIVNKGDFVMNHMDLLTGWVDCSKYNGVTSPDYRVFKLLTEEEYSARYYTYIMQICYKNRIFYGLGQGVSNLGRWRLQTDKFINFMLPIPSKVEQEQIVDYLNKKCDEIDNLITQKQLLLIELHNYKKSLIYECVTGKREVV